MSLQSEAFISRYYDGWLPTNDTVRQEFIANLSSRATAILDRTAPADDETSIDARPPSYKLTAAVAAFKVALNADAEMVELFKDVTLQTHQSSGQQVDSLDHLVTMINLVVQEPPRFFTPKNGAAQPIGVPLFLIFDHLSNTAAGFDLFRKKAYNSALKGVLEEWGSYLETPDSNNTLHEGEGGWFSKEGIESLEDKGRGRFEATYVCPDPHAGNRGFKSWDAFFTREVQDQARPILFPQPEYILSACESTTYHISSKVAAHDQFWLKGRRYSLFDMLNRDERTASAFAGGTVYQAFLSPQDYHRWRSPVAGTVTKVVVVDGTYYAVLPDEGDPDLPSSASGALIRSQAWLTHSAARAVIHIKSDNPDIGTVVFIGVGMAEVSTCEATVREGDRLEKGGQLGMFHFGGSTHVLLFGPEVDITFVREAEVGTHVKVLSPIAYVKSKNGN